VIAVLIMTASPARLTPSPAGLPLPDHGREHDKVILDFPGKFPNPWVLSGNRHRSAIRAS
jgi:hypothetical protein